MSFEEFMANVRKYHFQNPEQRSGQVLYNKLYELRPDLVDKIEDPFHVTNVERINAIVAHLKSIW